MKRVAARWMMAVMGLALVWMPGEGRAAEPGFTPLFNGRDLSGWMMVKKEAEGYVVRDGLLVCPAGSSGNLYTEKMYSDFILRAEFKLDPAANNGIGIRAATEGGNPSTTGFEVQILDDYDSGNRRLPMENMCGSIYRIIPSRRWAVRPAGEWNDIEIRAIGRRIEVILNGRDVLITNLNDVNNLGKYMEQPGFVRFRGHIGLLGHKPSTVAYRKVEIMEMPNSRADNEPPDGFERLFNGIDISDWVVLTADGAEEGHWRVADGTLTLVSDEVVMKTDRTYRNFELLMDWRIEPGGDAGLWLSDVTQVRMWDNALGSGGLQHEGEAPAKPAKKMDAQAGQWNRFHIVVVNGRVNVFLNDELVTHNAPVKTGPGRASEYPLLLQVDAEGKAARFRNIFIRELPDNQRELVE